MDIRSFLVGGMAVFVVLGLAGGAYALGQSNTEPTDDGPITLAATATATAEPASTSAAGQPKETPRPRPTSLPDRNSCDAIRGTDYRSSSERTFFLESCVAPEPTTPPQADSDCHPSYSGCLHRYASDYDCIGGSGNGPYYTGPVIVYGPDVFGLDRDGDGIGCE